MKKSCAICLLGLVVSVCAPGMAQDLSIPRYFFSEYDDFDDVYKRIGHRQFHLSSDHLQTIYTEEDNKILFLVNLEQHHENGAYHWVTSLVIGPMPDIKATVPFPKAYRSVRPKRIAFKVDKETISFQLARDTSSSIYDAMPRNRIVEAKQTTKYRDRTLELVQFGSVHSIELAQLFNKPGPVWCRFEYSHDAVDLIISDSGRTKTSEPYTEDHVYTFVVPGKMKRHYAHFFHKVDEAMKIHLQEKDGSEPTQ